MMVSPFTFYRGAAKIMVADLKDTPVAGLNAQLCGDAHLSNFGVFASPERTLLFDLNDFDETLPGPFEYDVKRMAASFTIAARNNGFSKADANAVTAASVMAYREALAAFADMPTMDVWYAQMDEGELMAAVRGVVAVVGKDLSIPGHPEILVTGDVMRLDKLPGVAEVAMQTGLYAGGASHIRPGDGAFKYRDLGSAAYISRGKAVVSAFKLHFGGFLGWWVWLFIHIGFLTGYRNRIGAVLGWWFAFTRDIRRERTFTIDDIPLIAGAYRELGDAATSGPPGATPEHALDRPSPAGH